MPRPVEKYGKLLCPVCGKELVKSTVRYPKATSGVFKTSTMLKEVTYSCSKCNWNYVERSELH